MLVLALLYVFNVVWVTLGQNNVFARDQCSPFNGNELACNENQFMVPGFGYANCTYVTLTSLEPSENPLLAEKVCLPDHCGLFFENQTRCETDIYCSWENDPTTQGSDVYRCFPACFNKIDIMFLVDGTTSQIDLVDPNTGISNFEVNLREIQDFVRYDIPDKGIYNDLHETREWFISFGGQQDGGEFIFPQTLDFQGSESLTQQEASVLIRNLTAPTGGTNLRRTLVEVNYLFESQTNLDSQRVLYIFSDGAATDAEYLEFYFPELGISDFSDTNLRVSLGQINCDNFGSFPFIACVPVQYFDLGPAIWDPLDVYYQFYLLGDEVQVFPPAIISNGSAFARNFVVNPAEDIIQINDDEFGYIFSILIQDLSPRIVDASICSVANTPAPVDESCGSIDVSSIVCDGNTPSPSTSCDCNCDLDDEIGNLFVDESCIGEIRMYRIRENEAAAVTPVEAGIWRRADGFRIGRDLYNIDPSTCVTITCDDGIWAADTCVNNIARCESGVDETTLVPRGFFGGPPKEPERGQPAMFVV